MNTNDTRNTFIRFFKERGHELISSGSLIPPDPQDPVLFVTSGMHPLIPYLKGRPHPSGRRLVNSQRCLRTTDLDEVGDSTHLTVFEMLGSWSLGDYSHEQSLRWGWELLTGGFGIQRELMSVTVFGGDDRCPPDERSREVWSELGLDKERIVPMVKENWWTGPDGMCGPDSEMFVWSGGGEPQGDPGSDGRWVEVWNHVSMRYRETRRGLVELPQRRVDTGVGFERLLMLLQGVDSVYETDLFVPLMRELERWPLEEGRRRLLSDHLRSLTVMVSDGVRPSNTGRGYVLRRLLRRVLTELWQREPTGSLSQLDGEVLRDTLGLSGVDGDVGHVHDVLDSEERRFRDLVTRGRTLVERELRGGPLTEEQLCYLYETRGLPRELVSHLVVELEGRKT